MPSGDSPTRINSADPRHCPVLVRKTIPVLFALVAACASLGQSFAQGPLADQQPTTIHGTVVNSVTHAPISRALVYSPDNRYAMLTDGEGHFEFTLPKTESSAGQVLSYEGQARQTWPISAVGGSVWLMARKPGYLDDPNERRQPPPAGDNTIYLMPEALIKGRVVISEADPPSAVSVELYSQQVDDGMPRWVRSSSRRTNSEGEFRFAELQPGTYKVLTNEWMDNDPVSAVPGAQPYGFPPVFYPGVSDFASASTITLTAGQSVQIDLTLTRRPYYPVSIPVANADQSGGLNIVVSVQGHRGPGYALGYDASKKVIDGSLPNGSYLVEANTYGQGSLTGEVHLTVAGAPAHGPAMTMIRSSSIEVRVSEEFTSSESQNSASFSSPAGTFELRGPRADFQPQLVTDEDFARQPGAYLRPPMHPNDEAMVFENLLPGKYWFRPGSNRGYVAAATMGTTDLLHEPLTVVAGSTGVIDVKMRDDFAEIDGTVTGISTESIPAPETTSSSIYVYCVPLPDGPGQFQQLGTSSSDGKFMSDRMAPGAYRILAFRSPQPRLPYRDLDAMKAYESLGPVVHLSPGQKTTVQVPIIAGTENE